jgi:uncharacterized protein YmfQ (DUF2313 family)
MPVLNLTSGDFVAAEQGLLPSGRVWPRDSDTVQAKVMAGLAPTKWRLAQRAGNLLVDAFPATTNELLPEWEDTLGLPDACVSDVLTIPQRQAAVAAKFAGGFAPTPANFIAFAASLGYAITITFPSPNVWVVHSATTTVTYFRAGANVAGEALATWGNTLLECLFRERCPAHTQVSFAYA